MSWAQVDLGERRHRHHSDDRLGRMAAEIWQTALARLHRDGDSTHAEATLTQFVRSSDAATGYRPVVHDVTALERPPMATTLRNEELDDERLTGR